MTRTRHVELEARCVDEPRHRIDIYQRHQAQKVSTRPSWVRGLAIDAFLIVRFQIEIDASRKG
jgi:hypothetical protein